MHLPTKACSVQLSAFTLPTLNIELIPIATHGSQTNA